MSWPMVLTTGPSGHRPSTSRCMTQLLPTLESPTSTTLGLRAGGVGGEREPPLLFDVGRLLGLRLSSRSVAAAFLAWMNVTSSCWMRSTWTTHSQARGRYFIRAHTAIGNLAGRPC